MTARFPHDKITTVRIPVSLWVKLRRLQEKRGIGSINKAVLAGLEMLIDSYAKRED